MAPSIEELASCARHRAVVVVHDLVDRLVDHARVVIGDERVAQEAGQVVGVAAEPDPCDQQHRQHQTERGKQRLSSAFGHVRRTPRARP